MRSIIYGTIERLSWLVYGMLDGSIAAVWMIAFQAPTWAWLGVGLTVALLEAEMKMATAGLREARR